MKQSKYEKRKEISICPNCNSMTHTINDKCGKCGAMKQPKDTNSPVSIHSEKDVYKSKEMEEFDEKHYNTFLCVEYAEQCKRFLQDNFVPKSEIIIDEAEEKATDNFYRDYIPKSEVEECIKDLQTEITDPDSMHTNDKLGKIDILDYFLHKLNQLKG